MKTVEAENASRVLFGASSSSGRRSASRKRAAGLLVFVASASVVGALRSLLPARLDTGSDYVAFYEPVATRILEGHGLTMPDGGLAARYPPGFPLLLAGSFAVAALVGIPVGTSLTLLLSVGTGVAAVLVFLIASTVFSLRRAVIAAALFTTYPLFLWLTRQPNSEVPFLAPLYFAVLLFIVSVERRHWFAALACGIAIGVATLVRPITIGLGLVMAVMALLVRRELALRARAALALLVLLGNLLAILPWEWWLYQGTGKVILVSTASKRAIRDGLSFAGTRKNFREPVAVPSGVRQLVSDVEEEWGKGNLATLGDVASFLRAEFQQRPLAVAQMVGLKAVRSWYATDSHRSEMLVIGVQAVYLPLICLAGLRAYRAGGPMKRLAYLLSIVTLYFWIMTIVALSIVRYMVPAIGLLMVLLPATLPARVSKE